MALVAHLAPTITAHAWNADRSMLAICPNSPEVWIYTNCLDPDSSKWTKTYVLKEHDLIVSGMDWHPVTNQIVTCSHDRNAFVWTYVPAEDKWSPVIAILRLNRAAISVKWSPDGKKFAVASGAKSVPICFYEAENNWWVSLTIKKHKSSVLSVAWHPNSQIIATAACDFRCRILSATLTETEDVPDSGPFPASLPFGELYHDFDNPKGWVEDVHWSPSGNRLAFVSHDSVIHVATVVPGSEPICHSAKTGGLPYTAIRFLGEETLVAAGHQCIPSIYLVDPRGEPSFARDVDRKEEPSSVKASTSFGAARAMFAAKVDRGESGPSSDVTLPTKHQGAIIDMTAYSVPKGPSAAVTSFSSAGIDGRIVIWDLVKSCGASLAELRLA